MLSVSFNGADLSANAPNNVVLNGSTIVISNFNPDVNVGEYKCSVTNTIGGVARWSAVSFGLRETGMLIYGGICLPIWVGSVYQCSWSDCFLFSLAADERGGFGGFM